MRIPSESLHETRLYARSQVVDDDNDDGDDDGDDTDDEIDDREDDAGDETARITQSSSDDDYVGLVHAFPSLLSPLLRFFNLVKR